MGRLHSLLSPSGGGRWLACPPSARWEEKFPDVSNDAADEGTHCHTLSELYILNTLKRIPLIKYNSDLKKAKHNPYYNKEMDGYALDYTNFVLDRYYSFPDAMIGIEEDLSIEKYVPEGRGHTDAVIVAPGILIVKDLKYGKGVRVEAEGNVQLRLYALAAYLKYRLYYNIETVEMWIYQPRLDNISSYTITLVELLKWANEVVVPGAKMAFEGKGMYTPGKHCQFCKARNQCKALANYHSETAKYAFEDVYKLDDQAVSDILEKAADTIKWLNSITDYALHEAVNNNKNWPGFKLIAGKSNRFYSDPKKIVATLQKAKFPISDYMTLPQLVGITALEKNLSVAVVDNLLGKYLIKPKGSPALVPAWDKRAAINGKEAAKIAFADQLTGKLKSIM